MNTAMQDWMTPPGLPPSPPNEWSVIPMHTLWDAGAGNVAPGSSVISAHWQPTWATGHPYAGYGDFAPRGAGGYPASSSQYVGHQRTYGAAPVPMPDWFRPVILLGAALMAYSVLAAPKKRRAYR